MTKTQSHEEQHLIVRTRFGHRGAVSSMMMATVLASALVVASAGAKGASTRTTTTSRDGVRTEDSFEWSKRIEPGKTLEIKGINGDIRVLPAATDKAEVRANKTARKSDPDQVTVEVIEHEDGVTICAHYPAPFGMPENECSPGAGGHSNTRNNDVRVEFTVHVPAGVKLAARTVNGDVEVDHIRSDAEVATVNGSIEVSTTGSATATTVNGSVVAEIGRASWTEPLEFETVNGRVTVTLPDRVSADVNAQTVNGDISTDFPFTVSGRINRHKIHAKIGNGGGDLSLTTVNGDIELRSKSGSH